MARAAERYGLKVSRKQENLLLNMEGFPGKILGCVKIVNIIILMVLKAGIYTNLGLVIGGRRS